MFITKERLEEEKKLIAEDNAHFKELNLAVQEKALAWIEANIFPGKKPILEQSSYGMKHIIKCRTGIYMKKAMLIVGFFPVDRERLNWHFCFKKSSPIYVMQKDLAMRIIYS